MTQSLPTDFSVDYELMRLMRRIRLRSMGRLAEIHQRLDYNGFLFFVAIADAHEGIRASDIAEALKVHKSTVSRAVSALERLELIERHVDPHDGRAYVLKATDEAACRLAKFRARSHRELGDLMSDWSPGELNVFASQLRRLNAAFEPHCAPPST